MRHQSRPWPASHDTGVMPALVAGMHVLLAAFSAKGVGGQGKTKDKTGHDGTGKCST
jgi:hypothetical protein